MSDLMHNLGYLATRANYPNQVIFSQRHLHPEGLDNQRLVKFLNPCPTYSSGFLVYDKETKDTRDRVTLVWVLFCKHGRNSDNPDNGIINLSETKMREMLTRYYLYHNVHTTQGKVLRPKARVIVVMRSQDTNKLFFSSPIKMKYFVSWSSRGDTGFDCQAMANTYIQNLSGNPNALDPRAVFPGHIYHELRSNDYQVERVLDEKQNQLIYRYPFDMCNPEHRVSKKQQNDYLYKVARSISAEELKEKVKNLDSNQINTYLSIKGDTENSVKRTRSFYLPPKLFTDAYNLLKDKDPSDWVSTIYSKLPNYLLFDNYDWHLSSPLQSTVKEMLYEPE